MKLLWLDLETTGLDKSKHEILEVAVTTAEFLNPFEPTMEILSWAKSYDNPTHENLDPFIVDLHTKNGLFDDCRKSALTLWNIEDLILTFVEEVEDKEERTVIAGSTIHFDLGFVERYMPRLAKRLSYRCYDVTAIKLMCRSFGMTKQIKGEAHRAAADILESITHAKECKQWLAEHFWLKKHFSEVPPIPTRPDAQIHLSERNTLADDLQYQISRVRDQLIPVYTSIGAAGSFALANMRADLDAAVKALAEGDAVECIRRYKSLKEWKL